MADWEQPSTTTLRKEDGEAGSGNDIETLRQELATAFARILDLEARVQKLETAASGEQGRALGA
jgi:hypothetical protein